MTSKFDFVVSLNKRPEYFGTDIREGSYAISFGDAYVEWEPRIIWTLITITLRSGNPTEVRFYDDSGMRKSMSLQECYKSWKEYLDG